METEDKSEAALDYVPMGPPLLPPCRVCGEKASGFHYGVNTCEACKGFFRRSLARKKEYRCRGNKKCTVIGNGKNGKCPKCRFALCLKLGMSRDGIQNGRYTIEKRNKYIKEVKGENSGGSGGDDYDENDSGPSDSHSQESLSDSGDGSVTSCVSKANIPAFTEERIMEMQAAISTLMKAHYEVNTITEEFLATKEQREIAFLEEQKAKEGMFGKMKFLPTDEYVTIKKETGIDVDGREEIVKKHDAVVGDIVVRTVTFAKALPYFSTFASEDQLTMVKYLFVHGALDMMEMERFNFERRLYHSPTGLVLNPEMIQAMCPNDDGFDMGEAMFATSAAFVNLGLTKEELVLATTHYALMTDVIFIRKPEQIKAAHDLCVDCLHYLFGKNHPTVPPTKLFARLVQWYTKFRSMQCEKYTVESIGQKLHINFSKLFMEITHFDELI